MCRNSKAWKDCTEHKSRNPLPKDFWKKLNLPTKDKNDALFFQPTMDPKLPGHNLTFLDSARALKKNLNMKIQPDCDLDDGNPKRCNEKCCLPG